MVTKKEIKFADCVMLIDASYINQVVKDLSMHFKQVISRELPKADLSVLLECLAMDAGIKPGKRNIQVLFIYDKSHQMMDGFTPSSLKNELNEVAFQSELGEFQITSYEPSNLASREDLYVESVKVIADAKEVKTLILVPSENEYAEQLPPILQKFDKKDFIGIWGMNPLLDIDGYHWEMLGYGMLQSLGIKANEI